EEVMEAIQAHSEANKLVEVENAPSNDGSGVVTAMGETALSGGDSGTNWVTTTNGVMTTFERTNDVLLINNGVDNMRYVDLATLDVLQFSKVDDPTSTLTAAGTGINTTGSFMVYYAISYNGPGGTTAIGPILSQAVSKSRSTWNPDTPEYLT